MEVFQELAIDADAERMKAIVQDVESILPPCWTRDRQAERELESGALDVRSYYCFSRSAEGSLPAARLVLTRNDPGPYHVSNIIPLAKDQLSYHEYNSVLREFVDVALRGAAERAGATIELSDAEADLDRWLSPSAAEKLRSFSTLANKRTGSAHWADRDRWNDFVLSAHREGSRMSPSTLVRWLVEVERWPAEVAEQLALEYEFGRELLEFAGEPRRSA